MLKKLSVVALAGLLSLPAIADAAPSVDQLQQQIEQLSQELNKLRTQMQEIKDNSETAVAKVADLKDQSEKWNESSRFQLSGDFRSRIDFNTADTPSHWKALDVGAGIADFMTAGNVMDRYNGMNSGTALVGDFAVAFAGPGFGGPPGSGYNPSSGQITNTGDTPTLISSNEAGAIGRVFSGASSLLSGFAAYPISGVSPNFTELSNLTAFMKDASMGMSPAARDAIFKGMGYTLQNPTTYDNDTMWTNRLRVNMSAKATENVVFKGRLAMYKAWGMQNNPVDYTANNGLGGGPYMLSSLSFDGSSTRQPQDNVLRVDRAYVNWSDIGDQPIWFSIGRRPTTDGPPGHLRQGSDDRMATPTAYMDYPFDGLTLGYAYDELFGVEDFPGKIRFCYGRGFEAGPVDNSNGLKDVDFAGISWDVFDNGKRFVALQSFVAFDMFNVPDNITFPNPVEFALWKIDPGFYDPTDSTRDLVLNRKNLGNIYHTTGTYMDKYEDNLDYFLSVGWSRTDPRAVDELGTSLLTSFEFDDAKVEAKDGYSLYAGLRYKVPESRVGLGLEYNYGSKNWIGFTPGHDDMTQGKLSARGHVVEAYMTYRFPAGDKISRFSDFFMRLGAQHYQYNYTGSGFWLGEPLDIDTLANDPLSAQFYTPIDTMDQVYLSIETYF